MACQQTDVFHTTGVQTLHNTNLGDYNTQRAVATPAGDVILQFDSTSTLASIVPESLQSPLGALLGVPPDLMAAAINSPLMSVRSRIHMVCDPAVRALPKLEPVQPPQTAGALQMYSFSIRHACACANMENCTAPIVVQQTISDNQCDL